MGTDSPRDERFANVGSTGSSASVAGCSAVSSLGCSAAVSTTGTTLSVGVADVESVVVPVVPDDGGGSDVGPLGDSTSTACPCDTEARLPLPRNRTSSWRVRNAACFVAIERDAVAKAARSAARSRNFILECPTANKRNYNRPRLPRQRRHDSVTWAALCWCDKEREARCKVYKKADSFWSSKILSEALEKSGTRRLCL